MCTKKGEIEKKVSHTGFEQYYFNITYTIIVFINICNIFKFNCIFYSIFSLNVALLNTSCYRLKCVSIMLCC